ncbi:MAG: lecithin retinol acyltransferase family protein [Coleofasciculus sp. S288]|nr:lecithin retinol acyltransferase family protein [Coleofasciculus sp. S288]
MARGDQIYVFRPFLNLQGIYEHHGIDCGDGTVIHYRKPSETIERTSLATFSQGQKIYLKRYPVGFISDVAVQRAESRLGERKYNLLFNNCEHFANWCKTGISDSQQVRNFVPIINQMNPDQLYDCIKRSLQETDQDNASQLLSQALANIRLVWDSTQPQYKQAVQEVNAWQKVAIQALKLNREDLARAALIRKRNYEKSANEKKATLDQLAKMTETLIRNRLNVQKTS